MTSGERVPDDGVHTLLLGAIWQDGTGGTGQNRATHQVWDSDCVHATHSGNLLHSADREPTGLDWARHGGSATPALIVYACLPHCQTLKAGLISEHVGGAGIETGREFLRVDGDQWRYTTSQLADTSMGCSVSASASASPANEGEVDNQWLAYLEQPKTGSFDEGLNGEQLGQRASQLCSHSR